MLFSDAGCCLSSALDGAHVQCPPFLCSRTWISEGRARVSCRLQNLPWIVRVQSRVSTSSCFLVRMTLKLFFIPWELLPPNNREWKKAKWFAKLLQRSHRCLYSDLLWVQNYLGVKLAGYAKLCDKKPPCSAQAVAAIGNECLSWYGNLCQKVPMLTKVLISSSLNLQVQVI